MLKLCVFIFALFHHKKTAHDELIRAYHTARLTTKIGQDKAMQGIALHHPDKAWWVSPSFEINYLLCIKGQQPLTINVAIKVVLETPVARSQY